MINEKGFLSDESVEGIKIIRKRFSDAFEIADEVNRTAVSIVGNMNLGKWEDKSLVLLSTLLVRLTETYEAILILLERGMSAQAKILARSMLDMLFPFLAICKDKNLLETYLHQQEHAQCRQLKSALDIKNKELRKVIKNLGYEKKYLELKENLKSKSGPILKTIDWAKKANLQDLYNFHYVWLCDATHSNLSALNEHVDITPSGDRTISFGPNLAGLYETLHVSSGFLSMALIAYSREDKAVVNKLHKLQNSLEKLSENIVETK